MPNATNMTVLRRLGPIGEPQMPVEIDSLMTDVHSCSLRHGRSAGLASHA